MLAENITSEKGKKKLQLYFAATYLFNKGKSHPQIVEMLEKYEPNLQNLIPIVDKAMHEEWDKLYQEANDLFSKGLNYSEVLQIISQKEADSDITPWICGEWYKFKILYAECLTEGATNKFEGLKWIVICAIGIPILFYVGSSWIIKTIWIISFVLAVIQWVVGIKQKDMANRINRLFAENNDLEIQEEVT